MTQPDASKRIVAVYLTATALTTTAAALIWGVMTLYLMRAGLDIFQVMLVHAVGAVSQFIFEVPTGVVADTIGRKASYLISLGLLVVSTLFYLLAGTLRLGVPGFAAGSALLTFAWTFQTGAVDAWLVDALDHTGWVGPKDVAFARGGIASEVSLIVGTLAGGFLGQYDLAWPFVVRALILVAAFVFVASALHDTGFERRPLKLSGIGEEMRRVLRAGVAHGWRNPVVRPLMLENVIAGAFFVFGFYSLQPYLLDLLGKQVVWAAAAVTAAGSVAGIAGNALVGRIMRGRGGRRRPARVLAAVSALAALGTAGAGLLGILMRGSRGLGPVLGLTGLWLVICLGNGVLGPVRRTFLNEHIPSQQRATVLSFDALFEEMGAAGGQPAFGWMSRAYSIPVAWAVGGVFMLAGLPFFRQADRAAGHRVQ